MDSKTIKTLILKCMTESLTPIALFKILEISDVLHISGPRVTVKRRISYSGGLRGDLDLAIVEIPKTC